MSRPELKLPPLPPFCSGPFKVNRATNWIEGVDVFGGPCHMLDVRGWGYLTGRGTALRLSDEVAIKAQRETAQWVVDAMNAAWNTSTPVLSTADCSAVKYGKRNVSKMIQQFNDLRQACRAEGTPAIQDALDKVDEHIDYAYRADPATIRADALREALECCKILQQFGDMAGNRALNLAFNAILALIGTPLSPTAVDGRPAPDAGGKEGV